VSQVTRVIFFEVTRQNSTIILFLALYVYIIVTVVMVNYLSASMQYTVRVVSYLQRERNERSVMS